MFTNLYVIKHRKMRAWCCFCKKSDFDVYRMLAIAASFAYCRGALRCSSAWILRGGRKNCLREEKIRRRGEKSAFAGENFRPRGENFRASGKNFVPRGKNFRPSEGARAGWNVDRVLTWWREAGFWRFFQKKWKKVEFFWEKPLTFSPKILSLASPSNGTPETAERKRTEALRGRRAAWRNRRCA